MNVSTTLAASASVLGGLGLFFFALHFLSQGLKQLASNRLRRNIARLTSNPGKGILVGSIMITVTQSAAASVFLLVGMVRAGLITLKQSQPVLLGVNIAAGLTVLFLTIDIQTAVMIMIGVAGITYVYGVAKIQRIAAAALGIGLLFLGLQIMREGAATLETESWFLTAVEVTRDAPIISFLIGAVLTVVSQSSLAVVVVMTALLDTGVMGGPEAMMFVYGTNVGASVLTYFLSSGLTGIARQVAYYQVAYNFLAAFIMVPLFYLEVLGGFPLVHALAQALADEPAKQMAIYFLVFNLVPFPFLLMFLGSTSRFLAKLSPETAAEEGSKPKYLVGDLPEDTGLALQLVSMEQARLIDILINATDALRSQDTGAAFDETMDAFDSLARTIRSAVNETTLRRDIDAQGFRSLDAILKVQDNSEAVRSAISGFRDAIAELRSRNPDVSFPDTVIEGIDTILHIWKSATDDPEDLDMLATMTSDAGNSTRAVRSAYLSSEEGVAPEDRNHLLAASNYTERLIWLVNDTCGALKEVV